MKRVILLLLAIILISFIEVKIFATTQDELDSLNLQKKEVTQELEGVHTELSQTIQEIDKLTQSISENELQVAVLNDELQILSKEIKESKKDLEEKEKLYTKEERLLQNRLIANYKSGTASYLDVLLNSSSLSDFISNYYYISKVAKSDRELLEKIENEKKKIEEIKNELEKKETKYKESKVNMEKINISLRNSKQIKNNYLAELSENERSLQAKIDEYDAGIASIEAEIRRVQAQNLNSDMHYEGGVMSWPLPGYIGTSSSFGYRFHPITGVWRMHTGLDIPAPGGTFIRAAEDGVVQTATYNSSYGNYLLIYHGGTTYTLYAHCSVLYKSVGDTATKGEVIADVGTTGSSTGNHLHFEVRQNGTYINPSSLEYTNR